MLLVDIGANNKFLTQEAGLETDSSVLCLNYFNDLNKKGL
mgnify:CR=1 FL=1